MSVNQDTAAHALLPRAEDAPGRDEGYWRRCATCRGKDPELFFPVGSAGPALAQIAEAKKTCRCAVRGACLVFAMATGQEHRIWGGLTEDERRRLRRRRVAWNQTAAVPALITRLPRG